MFTCAMKTSVLVCSGAITTYPRLDGVRSRNLFSPNSGRWKIKIKVWAGLVSSEAYPLVADGCVFSVFSQGRKGREGERERQGQRQRQREDSPFLGSGLNPDDLI